MKTAKSLESDKTTSASLAVKGGKESGGFLADGRSLRGILNARLGADPHLVSRFWTELVDPARVQAPDITAIYCRFISQGQTCLAVEFVSGETLEQFVGKMDPAAGERMIPLFSAVLDSFDEAQKDTPGTEVRTVKKLARHDVPVEVIDLGVIRAIAAVPCDRQHGVLVIEGGRIDPTEIHNSGRTVPNPVSSLALFAEQQLSHDFRFANSPGDVSEVVIASVLSDRQSYCLAHIEHTPVSPSELAPNLPPCLEEGAQRALNTEQPKLAMKARLGAAWWLAFGIAATLAVGALLNVSRRSAAPLRSLAGQVAAGIRTKEAAAEPLSAAPLLAAPEAPGIIPFPSTASKRQRKSLASKRQPLNFKPIIWPPKEDETPPRPGQGEDRSSAVSAQAPAQEEVRPSEPVQQAASSQSAVQMIPKEPATNSQTSPTAKKGPGLVNRAMGKIFSFGRKRKQGASSLKPGEQTVTKP
jgi:hypothetical protein